MSTKVRLVKAMAFPVVMYGCESWTVKKAEHLTIDAFFFPPMRNVLFVFNFIIIIIILTLQYCIGFAIHQHASATGVHMFPILNPPPHTIPLGHPNAPAPSFLYPASNLNWQFVSYMILYMF